MKPKSASYLRIDYIGILLIIVLVAPTVVWNYLNAQVWNWDEAFYGSGALSVLVAGKKSFILFIKSFVSILGTKAPFISWFGTFCYLVFSHVFTVEFSLMCVQIITSLVILYLIHKYYPKYIVYNLNLPIATVFFASVPFFIVLSRYFLVELLQALSVVYILIVSFKRKELSFTTLLFHAVFSITFMFSVKISTPVYVFMLYALIVFELAKKSKEWREVLKINLEMRIFLPLFSCFLIATFSWYYTNFNSILEFSRSAASGSISLLYGKKLPFLNKLFYWVENLRLLLMGYFKLDVLYLLTSISLLISFRRLFKDIDFIIVLLQIVLTIVLFSFQVTNETRFLFPLIPLFTYVLVRLCVDQKWFGIIVMLFSLSQWLHFNIASFGYWNYYTKIPFAEVLNRNDTYKTNANVLINELCYKGSKSKIVVGVDVIFLNADTLTFIAFSQGLGTDDCHIITNGHAASDANLVLDRVHSFKPDFVVFLPHEKLKTLDDQFNRVSLTLYEKLLEEKWSYRDTRSNYTILENTKTNL